MKQIWVILLILFYPLLLSAQAKADVLERVSTDITERKWAELKESFHEAVQKDADDAGTFFWRSIDAAKESKWIMAWELGDYYKGKGDYDKACPFFAELNRLFPNDIPSLSIHAEMEVLRGKE